MPEKPFRVAQLMRSASRGNAGVFVAARGLSLALARQPDLRLEVFAVKDTHTQADWPQWESIPVHGFPMPPPAFPCQPLLSLLILPTLLFSYPMVLWRGRCSNLRRALWRLRISLATFRSGASGRHPFSGRLANSATCSASAHYQSTENIRGRQPVKLVQRSVRHGT